MITLRASGIDFSYGRREVLRSVGIESLEPGQLAALIGPNASGKSTLFKVISGLLKPRGGEIWLGDTELSTLPLKTRLKRVCFMPQTFTANASLTVFDVVMMAHKQVKGWRVSSDDIYFVSNALHDAGIGSLSEAYISELSGGQAQMVSVAQTLVRQSNVYLFDEPTSALDLNHQLMVLSRIRSQVQKRGVIGIVALHDLNLAARFADKLILLDQGQVVSQGTPIDLLPLAKVADTYGVDIETLAGPREELTVHAYSI